MSEQQATGVYQLDNGYWGYRFVITINGKKKAQKRVKNEFGNPYKTQKQAAKARKAALEREHAKALLPPVQNKILRKTVKEVYQEYCEKGRSGDSSKAMSARGRNGNKKTAVAWLCVSM